MGLMRTSLAFLLLVAVFPLTCFAQEKQVDYEKLKRVLIAMMAGGYTSAKYDSDSTREDIVNALTTASKQANLKTTDENIGKIADNLLTCTGGKDGLLINDIFLGLENENYSQVRHTADFLYQMFVARCPGEFDRNVTFGLLVYDVELNLSYPCNAEAETTCNKLETQEAKNACYKQNYKEGDKFAQDYIDNLNLYMNEIALNEAQFFINDFNQTNSTNTTSTI